MALSNDQQVVADQFMNFLSDPNHNEMAIEGFPGCGKSYLTKYLIDAVRAKSQLTQLISPGKARMTIHCTATTNKAAAVLSDLSGQEAKTIHSLLGLKVTNNFSTGATSLKKSGNYAVVENSLVFVDEASYENQHLLDMIRKSTMNCKVVHIGDRYQLATVGEKNCPVFTDVALKGVLRGSQRFAATGPIATLAAQYRATIDGGPFPDIHPDGVVIKHCTGPEFQDEINKEFGSKTINNDHAKIIAWSNNMVHAYNKYVRGLYTQDEAFQPGEMVVTNKPILIGGGSSIPTETLLEVTDIKPGTESGVMGWWVTLNNKVNTFQPFSQKEVKAMIKNLAEEAKVNRDWRSYFATQDFFADLRPIHAATVYKAQGSTYKKVFIDLNDIGKCTQAITVARMLLVAITRAADEVVLYGHLPSRYGSIV